jgi:hypothetical protein
VPVDLSSNKPLRPLKEKMSERRDSNPQPSPWQGDAQPIELLPQLIKNLSQYFKKIN